MIRITSIEHSSQGIFITLFDDDDKETVKFHVKDADDLKVGDEMEVIIRRKPAHAPR